MVAETLLKFFKLKIFPFLYSFSYIEKCLHPPIIIPAIDTVLAVAETIVITEKLLLEDQADRKL